MNNNNDDDDDNDNSLIQHFAAYAALQGGSETLYSINITLNYEYYIYTDLNVIKAGSEYLIVHRLPTLFVLADTGTLVAGPDIKAYGLSCETRYTKLCKRGEEERDRLRNLIHASSLLCCSVIRSAFASASPYRRRGENDIQRPLAPTKCCHSNTERGQPKRGTCILRQS